MKIKPNTTYTAKHIVSRETHTILGVDAGKGKALSVEAGLQEFKMYRNYAQRAQRTAQEQKTIDKLHTLNFN